MELYSRFVAEAATISAVYPETDRLLASAPIGRGFALFNQLKVETVGTLLKKKDLEVLIIDDEKDICYLLGSLFKGKNLDTAYVNSIQEAENILEITHPDVVFLDNYLPDGLGIDFIRKIKKMHPSTIVVMITAHDNLADRAKALAEGADYFISKPFTRESVTRTVERLIN